MTCGGEACRLARRRRAARRRRRAELREYRVDDRERKRDERRRKKGASGVVVSRAGLAPEVALPTRVAAEIADEILEASRAGLERQVSRVLRFSARNRGKEVGADA